MHKRYSHHLIIVIMGLFLSHIATAKETIVVFPFNLTLPEKMINLPLKHEKWKDTNLEDAIHIYFVNMCCGIDKGLYQKIAQLIESDPAITEAYCVIVPGSEPGFAVYILQPDETKQVEYFELISRWIPPTNKDWLGAVVKYKDRRTQTKFVQ